VYSALTTLILGLHFGFLAYVVAGGDPKHPVYKEGHKHGGGHQH